MPLARRLTWRCRINEAVVGIWRNISYNFYMTVQTFCELLSQQPFQPFRLVMSNGEQYEVRHPEMAMLTRTDILVGTDESEDGVPAEFRICSLLHVATIEPLGKSSPDS